MAEASIIPIYAFAEGDTMGVLLLVEPHETLADVLTHTRTAVRVRVDGALLQSVEVGGHALELDCTVEQAGLQPLDCIAVRRSHGTP